MYETDEDQHDRLLRMAAEAPEPPETVSTLAAELALAYEFIAALMPLALHTLKHGGGELTEQREFWNMLSAVQGNYCDILDLETEDFDDGPNSITKRIETLEALAKQS